MKADTTRSTFKQARHYNAVLMQQGRVQLDADWNEQIDITGHRFEVETIDVIGSCGAPLHDSGFHIVTGVNDLTAEEKVLPENQNPTLVTNDLLISGGRYYVDGILCENDQIIAWSKQLDLPNLTVTSKAGTYLAYLDVWSRHITALEDPAIREVALGGPDTATRSKTVWQVKLFQIPDGSTCATALPTWNDEIAAGTGRLAAQAATSTQSNDPCIVAPGAGFRRLENQHYRVEVHDKGKLGTATFKWSRDNGSIVTKWESQSGAGGVDLTVSGIGRDKVLSFGAGQYVELIDDNCELLNTPGTLVKLVKAEGNVLTIDPATATGPTAIANFPKNPRVRRWDMPIILKPTTQNFLDLEDGVQVKFVAGNNDTYKTGDYWLIPARTATADVEWPIDPTTNKPANQLPFGIKHHYCRLAVIKNNGPGWTNPLDCRRIFPPLTELINFLYVGGDGQEAMPDLTQPSVLTQLAQPLEAAVMNDIFPVKDANVRFTVIKGNGRLQGNVTTVTVPTGANGVAKCTWSLDAATQNQQVEAVLLDSFGNVICEPIHYSANLSVAAQVAYLPAANCSSLQNRKTVQQAIDTLASLASLYMVSGDNQTGQLGQVLEPLTVIVANKCGPIQGMNVVFTIRSGGGTLNTPQPVITNAQGLAQCAWTLGSGTGTQVVEAVLQPGANQPIVAPVSVQFQAQLRLTADADPGFHVTGITFTDGGDTVALFNNRDLRFNLLANGVRIACDGKPHPDALLSQHPNINPVCFITIDVPFPMVPQDREFFNNSPQACFESIILGAQASTDVNLINWFPNPATMIFLNSLFNKLLIAELPQRVLAHLTLKGNFIWNLTNPDMFLDADVFADHNLNSLKFPSGNQKRGGTLDMWFWLIPPTGAAGIRVNVGPAAGGLAGTVTDQSGAPVAGTTVNIVGGGQTKTVTTDAQGQFRVTDLAPGDFQISVTGTGNVTETVPFTVTSGPILKGGKKAKD